MCKWGTDVTVRLAHPLTASGKKKVAVDACLAPLVQILNDYGVHTTGCCCGHGREAGSVLYEQDDQQHELMVTAPAIAPTPPFQIDRIVAVWGDAVAAIQSAPGAPDYIDVGRAIAMGDLMADALTQSCGTCAHWLDESVTHKVGFCTSQVSWHNGKAMPGHEMCTKWSVKDDA